MENIKTYNKIRITRTEMGGHHSRLSLLVFFLGGGDRTLLIFNTYFADIYKKDICTQEKNA